MAVPAAPITIARATPPPYGLIQSSRTLADGDITLPPGDGPNADLQTIVDYDTPRPRWAAGFTIHPDPCGAGSALAIDPCGTSGGPTGVEPGTIGPVIPQPIAFEIECSTFGASGYQARADLLRRTALATVSFGLEREFWLGTSAQAGGYTTNQWLARPFASGGPRVINSGGPMGSVTALAELEQAIAEGSAWSVGMIHAQPRVVSQWTYGGQLDKVGNLLVTKLGTIVVPGRGYTGDGPAAGTGDSPATLGGDVSWAYATSLVYTMLGPLTLTADSPVRSLDRDANTMKIRGHIDAAAAFDGCIYAAAAVLGTSERTALGS